MERGGTGNDASGAAVRRPRPRYVFQVDSATEGAVIRIFDTASQTIFREIPVHEFLAFARKSKDIKSLFFGEAGAALAPPGRSE